MEIGAPLSTSPAMRVVGATATRFINVHYTFIASKMVMRRSDLALDLPELNGAVNFWLPAVQMEVGRPVGQEAA